MAFPISRTCSLQPILERKLSILWTWRTPQRHCWNGKKWNQWPAPPWICFKGRHTIHQQRRRPRSWEFSAQWLTKMEWPAESNQFPWRSKASTRFAATMPLGPWCGCRWGVAPRNARWTRCATQQLREGKNKRASLGSMGQEFRSMGTKPSHVWVPYLDSSLPMEFCSDILDTLHYII